MAQGIDSKAIADYLAGTRGANILPSFSDNKNQSFYGEGDIELDMNPLIETESEEERLERERKEEIELKKAEWKAAEEYTTLEELREAKIQHEADMIEAIRQTRNKLREDQGIPRLEEQRALLSKTGALVFQDQIARIDQQLTIKNTSIDRQLAYDGNSISGIKTADFSDYQFRGKQLASREKTLIMQESDKQDERRKETSSKIGRRDKAAETKRTVAASQGLTLKAVEKVEDKTGSKFTGEDIATWDQDKVKLAQKIALASQDTLVSSPIEAGIMTEQTQQLAIAHMENELTADEYPQAKQLLDQINAEVKVGIQKLKDNQETKSRVTLNKHENDSYTKPAQKKLALEQKLKVEKYIIVEQFKNKYMDSKLTVDLFDPATMNLDSQGKQIADTIYDYMLERYGRGTKLSTFGYFQINKLKEELGTSQVAEIMGINAREIHVVFEKMKFNVGTNYNRKYSRISGTIISGTNSIIDRF